MKSMLYGMVPLILFIACVKDNGLSFIGRSVPIEDYAVYNALIEEHYAGINFQILVIMDSTRLEMVNEFFPIDTILAWYGLEIPEDIASDFMDNNRQAFKLDTLFELKVPYKLISTQEIYAIFGQQCMDGWDTFYQQYPNSQGTMMLSRVGYNAEMNKALVTIGNQSHCEAGMGFIVLMAKENGTWKIQSTTCYWIS